MVRRWFLSLIVVLCVASLARAQAPTDGDWPAYLGPDRNGVSRETNLSTDWRAQPPKLVYRVPLGAGFSSLCVVGDRVFTQTARGDRELVVAHEAATGREVWSRPICAVFTDTQGQGPGPRATPTYADGQLFCLFPGGDLACVNAADGQLLWGVNILTLVRAEDRAQETFFWGLSQSPLVVGDRVIVCPGGSRNNSVIGLDRKTGQLAWAGGSDPPGYGSPIEIKHSGETQVIAVGGQSLMAFEPASGKPLWRAPVGNKYNCNCATPVFVDERIFYSAAYGTGATLIELTHKDDKWTPKPRWTNLQLQNQMSTSIVLDGHIYGCNGDLGATNLRCLDLLKGTVKWIERAPGKCTLIAAAGHLIALSEDGTLRLIEANPNKYVEKGKLDRALAATAWTPPALSRGKLYLRDRAELFCVDIRGKSEQK
ncbi:MAG: PQQ-like beta-propeller repeat protein [Planctomycetaceae bacterium]|nr:PQQ-like beta-propeller repeat protein [Planctomycetaceae bacterium]